MLKRNGFKTYSLFFARKIQRFYTRKLTEQPKETRKLQLGPIRPRRRHRRRRRTAACRRRSSTTALERKESPDGRKVDRTRLQRTSTSHRHRHPRSGVKTPSPSPTPAGSAAPRHPEKGKRAQQLRRPAGSPEAMDRRPKLQRAPPSTGRPPPAKQHRPRRFRPDAAG